MKKIFMLSLLGFLLGCQSSQTNSDQNHGRHPSSVELQKHIACGRIELPENNHVALDMEDNNYAMKLDCNMDKKITKMDGRKLLLISSVAINSANRKWLVDQKRAIVNATSNPHANPYVCVKVKASANPCSQNKATFGFSPVFSTVK